jgi:sodium transport system ATP-binding protein
MSALIEVEGLAKSFGPVQALVDVGFAAERGRVLGLLGPNGAGKSTCLRIVATVMQPDAGRVSIDGIDVVRNPLAARRRLGVLPHRAGVYPQLTTRENIAYFARLHGLPERAIPARVDALIERLGLGALADRRAAGFSQGERTKLALARALVHAPPCLLLDEPTSGLDVIATRELRAWLGELKRDGHCIVLSSHVMQEIAALTDDLVILAHGKVAAAGTPQELERRFPGRSLEDSFVAIVTGAGP